MIGECTYSSESIALFFFFVALLELVFFFLLLLELFFFELLEDVFFVDFLLLFFDERLER